MDSHQHGFRLKGNLPANFDTHPAFAQRQMRLGIDDRGIGDQIEFAVHGRQFDADLALDKPFALAAIFDEIFDRTHFEIVPAAELAQVRQAGHAAVRVDDFANDRRLLQSGQAGQVDAAFGVAGADQHATGARTQTRHMALAADQIVRRRVLIDGNSNRAGAIKGRRPGGDARAGIDVQRERRRLRIDVVARQWLQMEPIADRRRHRQAHQAARVAHHEVNRFGRDFLGRDDQITLVLAELVVHEHDHAARPHLGQGFVDGAKIVRHFGHRQP